MRLSLESILAKSLFPQSVAAARGPGRMTAHRARATQRVGPGGFSQHSSVVAALLLVGLMLGCQTPLVAPQTVLPEVTSNADQRAATSPLLASLERRLAVDHWRIRPDWSPTISNTDMRRWELVDADDLPAAAKTSSDKSRPETGPGETEEAANDSPSDVVADTTPSPAEDGLEAKEQPASLGTLLNNLSSGLEASVDKSVSDKRGDVASLLEQLASREDFVGWNATILLAQRFPKKAIRNIETLQRLGEVPPSISQVASSAEKEEDQDVGPTETKRVNKSISVRMRAAAAEAWCLALAAVPRDNREALSPAGELLMVPDLPEAIREELLLALSERIPPLEVPGLADAFRRTADQPTAPVRLRRAAMQACILYAVHNVIPDRHLTDRHITGRDQPATGSEDGLDRKSAADSIELWPASIWNCQTDPDSTVRQEFGLWVSLLRHEEALVSWNRICGIPILG